MPMKNGLLRLLTALTLACVMLAACAPATPVLRPAVTALSPRTPDPTPGPAVPTGNPVAVTTERAAPMPEIAADPTALLAAMTLEDKVGQTLVLGFEGLSADAARQEITELRPGGIILFARNVDSPEQLGRLTADLQSAARAAGLPGLFIGIDQEGGTVARLTEQRGFTEFPGAMALAATGEPGNARAAARGLASEMHAVGINVDFAPVLDVNNNPANPVIGVRSFGSDPQAVARFGLAFAQGLADEGILATGKHFPGHGDTATDSHTGLPVVPHDRARLAAVESVPFQAAMDSGIPLIMSAHVVFPAIEPSGLAATLSPRVMNDLLRGEMKYGGLLITDSLEMGALATSGYGVPVAAATALKAGADLLLISHGPLALHRQARDQVLDWVRRGTIPEERLNQAVLRALTAKKANNLMQPAGNASGGSAVRAGSEQQRSLSRSLASGGITLLRDDRGLLPLRAGAPVVVFETAAAPGLGKALVATTYQLQSQPSPTDVEEAPRRAAGRTAVVATADVARYPRQAELVRKLLAAGVPTIVVAMRSPYDLLSFPDAPAYLVVYGSNPPLLEAAAGVLTGDITASGRLPVEIPGLYPLGAPAAH